MPRGMPSEDPPVRVRAATRGDIPAIVELSCASVSDEEEIGFGMPRSEQTFADVGRLSAAWEEPNRVRGEEVLVAEADGRLVGCVTLEDRGESLELVNIDVARDARGRGIGAGIVRFVEDRARVEGRRAVTLGTSRNAAGTPWRSLPWWLSLGYRITHEEENRWTRAIGPGVHEIRMRKNVWPVQTVDLRDVAESDLPILFEYQRNKDALRMAAFTAKDPSDRDAFLAHWRRILGDDAVLMRTILVEGQVVGNVGRFFDKQFGKPELTYWVGREYWGRGIATLAVASFLAEHPERPIYARAAQDNAASLRVLEKCRFRPVGKAMGFANARGAEIEEAILERLADPDDPPNG